jgi:uncharacterized OB-fold protein
MSDDSGDSRTIRLWDLKDGQHVVVRCPACGRMVLFPPGLLEKRHRVPGNTLVHDLRHRMRCQKCNTTRDITVTVEEPKLPQTGRRR